MGHLPRMRIIMLAFLIVDRWLPIDTYMFPSINFVRLPRLYHVGRYQNTLKHLKNSKGYIGDGDDSSNVPQDGWLKQGNVRKFMKICWHAKCAQKYSAVDLHGEREHSWDTAKMCGEWLVEAVEMYEEYSHYWTSVSTVRTIPSSWFAAMAKTARSWTTDIAMHSNHNTAGSTLPEGDWRLEIVDKQLDVKEVKTKWLSYWAHQCLVAKIAAPSTRQKMSLLREMTYVGITPNLELYSSAIDACAKDGMADEAVSLLRDMEELGITLNGASFYSSIKACANCRTNRKGTVALDLLRQMGNHDIMPDIVSYRYVMLACAKDGMADEVLGLLREMSQMGIDLDAVSFNAAIDACKRLRRGGKGTLAVDLLREMKIYGITTNVIWYNSAISACAKDGEADEALGLLRDMEELGITPNVKSFNAALDACAKCKIGGKGWVAQDLIREMKDRGIHPNSISYQLLIAVQIRDKADALQRDMDEDGFAANS